MYKYVRGTGGNQILGVGVSRNAAPELRAWPWHMALFGGKTVVNSQVLIAIKHN